MVRFFKEESGLEAIDYAVVLALVIVYCVTAWNSYGDLIINEIQYDVGFMIELVRSII